MPNKYRDGFNALTATLMSKDRKPEPVITRDAYDAVSDTLQNKIGDKANFGPNDSMIASAFLHPVTGAQKALEWIQSQVNTAAGMPQPNDDEGSIYQSAPLPIAQTQSALNLAGMAEAGSMPIAPRSSGGTLGTLIKPGSSKLDEYAGSHRAPINSDSSAPLHDLTKILPEDIYSSRAMQYYGTGDNNIDREAFAAFNKYRNKPDANVPIYRAVPKDATDAFNHGDWVTLSKKYAQDHGEAYLDNYKIIKETVPARSLFTSGDSPHEFGLDLTDVDIPDNKLTKPLRRRK